MRITLAASSLAFLALAGCGDYRDSMMVAPPRGGHAAYDPNVAPPPTAGSTTSVASQSEMYITMGAQDSLSSIAKAYGVTLDWLIKRNRLTDTPKPGANLIVPRPK
jgi:LysM repeat protein